MDLDSVSLDSASLEKLQETYNELIATVQGIWSVISNYGGNSEGVKTWWEAQYGKLVVDGFGGTGATSVMALLGVFSQFMPTSAVITTITEATT